MGEKLGSFVMKTTLFQLLLWIGVYSAMTSSLVRAEQDLAGNCALITLQKVSQTLKDSTDPCSQWVNAVFGRVHRVSGSSGAVWTTNTQFGTALSVTARHVLGDPPPISGQDIDEYFGPPGALDQTELFSYLPLRTATGVNRLRNQTFRILTERITADEYENHYSEILPKNDYVVAVLTERLLEDEQITFDPPLKEPVKINDPLKLLAQNCTFSGPIPGESVIVLGFPKEPIYSGEMVFSVGKVYQDFRAEEMIELDPSESKIVYDKSVEFAIDARSIPGMSGGGVFNKYGQYLGVVVRGNDEPIEKNKYFIRVIKAEYISGQIEEKLQILKDPEKSDLLQFLEQH